MFYCEKCAKENKWPESYAKSKGLCEMCGSHAFCNDVASSCLPVLKVNTEPKKQQQELETELARLMDYFVKTKTDTDEGSLYLLLDFDVNMLREIGDKCYRVATLREEFGHPY